MGPPLSPRATVVTDRILALLASEWPLPVPTAEIVERIGPEARRSLMAYRMLERLAKLGDVEKIAGTGRRSVCWRLSAPPAVAAECPRTDRLVRPPQAI